MNRNSARRSAQYHLRKLSELNDQIEAATGPSMSYRRTKLLLGGEPRLKRLVAAIERLRLEESR